MSYIVIYLIPFLGLSFSNTREIVGLLTLFLVIGVIYIQSNLIHMNPLLNIAGYHLFEVSTRTNKSGTLITKQRYIRTGDSISVVSLDDYTWLEKRL